MGSKTATVEENTCGFYVALLLSHMACVSRIFFFLTWDVMTEAAQDEEENSPSDRDGCPEMEVTHV